MIGFLLCSKTQKWGVTGGKKAIGKLLLERSERERAEQMTGLLIEKKIFCIRFDDQSGPMR